MLQGLGGETWDVGLERVVQGNAHPGVPAAPATPPRSASSYVLALGLALTVALTGIGVVSPTAAYAATPAFVQVKANEVASGTTDTLAFTNANTAGNLIAAYVIWNNVGTVSLADTRNNAYVAATARMTWGSSWSAQVFYAKNIAGGSNTVTATFGTALSAFGIVYLHEYSGLNKVNPVDVTAGAVGSAAAMSSGAVTTTNASDLLFAAGASSNAVTAAGSGFTTRSTASANRTEDRLVSATGSYAGTATQNGSAWVMQLVAFRADSGTSDVTPPTVGITAPTGGSVSGSVAVTANAADNVAVASVQFLLDGNALGAADTTSPYSVSWDTTLTANGQHTLTARATDTSGNATTSAPVTVTVANAGDVTPPTVGITAPTGGSVSGSVAVTANAADNVAVASVQFLLDGNALGAADTTSPYSVSWDTTLAANGQHTLTARATDTSGNATTSAPVTVTVANTVTSGPAFVQVKANEVASGTTDTLAFTNANTAGNLIAAYVIWNNVGTVSLADTRNNAYVAATARMTWGSSWSAQVFYAKNIAGGSNTVTATFGTALSAFGIVYLHEYSGLNKVNPVDVTAGAVGSAAAMSSGAVTTTNPSDLLFAAGASSNTVTAAGSGFTTRSTASANRTEDRLVSATGSYAGTATQNGSAWVMQLVAFRADSGTSDVTPPTVGITAPTGGSVSGSVAVTANAADNVAVASVQFLLDGNALGAADTTSPYSVSWDTTLAANGQHTLTARATDTSGNATTSAPVTVTVANTVTSSSAPIAAYAFNEGAGTTAGDSSGNSLTGTLVNGPTWTTGQYGSALNFDGVNDFVDLGNPTALQMTGSMTISGWINSSSFPAGDAAVVSKKTTDGTGYQLDTTIDGGARTVGFKLTNASGADMIRYGATPLQLNTWYDIAGVYNAANQTMDVYLNGVLDNGALVGTVTASQENSTANVSIGQRTGDPNNFNGRIDEVRMYNQPLTVAQVQTDMNTPLAAGRRTCVATVGPVGPPVRTPSLRRPRRTCIKRGRFPTAGCRRAGCSRNRSCRTATCTGVRSTVTSAQLTRPGTSCGKTFLGHTNDPSCTDPSSMGVASTATITTDVKVGSAHIGLVRRWGRLQCVRVERADRRGAVVAQCRIKSRSFPVVVAGRVRQQRLHRCRLVRGLSARCRPTPAARSQHRCAAKCDQPRCPTAASVRASGVHPRLTPPRAPSTSRTGTPDPCGTGGEPLAPAVVEVSASNLALGRLVGGAARPSSSTIPTSGRRRRCSPGSSPASSQALVGAINKNGLFYAFKRDALGAGPVWSTRIATGGGNPLTGNGDSASGAWDGTTLYVGGDNTTIAGSGCAGSLNALNPSTGAFIWRHCFTDGFVLGGVTGASGGVVAVGEGNNIAVLSAATGTSADTFTGVGPFLGPPSIANGVLYEGDMSGNLYALTTS